MFIGRTAFRYHNLFSSDYRRDHLACVLSGEINVGMYASPAVGVAGLAGVFTLSSKLFFSSGAAIQEVLREQMELSQAFKNSQFQQLVTQTPSYELTLQCGSHWRETCSFQESWEIADHFRSRTVDLIEKLVKVMEKK